MIQRGEIYFVNLNPIQGREQGGQRPVLVISADSVNQLPLVVTVVVKKLYVIAWDYRRSPLHPHHPRAHIP
jgi:mRNA-degrading endonuclease toxin of MazEF toxin-antitoxin module